MTSLKADHSKRAVMVGAGLLGAAMLLATSSSMAATATASMPVSATVAAACSISANSLAFGAYTSAQLDATTTLSVNCTSATTYNVGLDVGTGTGATTAARKMVNGAQTLTYTIYSDTGRTTLWGNTVGSNTVAGAGTGAAQSLNVYGRVASGQTPSAGSYADTLTATITY